MVLARGTIIGKVTVEESEWNTAGENTVVRSILKQVLTLSKVSGTKSFPERHFPAETHLRWLLQENDIKVSS